MQHYAKLAYTGNFPGGGKDTLGYELTETGYDVLYDILEEMIKNGNAKKTTENI